MQRITRKTTLQILSVINKTREFHLAGDTLEKAYQQAVGYVAKSSDVFYQTIGDACRRRLDLKDRDEFLDLLRLWLDNGSTRLEDLIKSKADEKGKREVDSFFMKSSQKMQPPLTVEPVKKVETETELFSIRVSKGVGDQIRIISEAKNKSAPEWLSARVSEVVNQEFTEWFQNVLMRLDANERRRILEKMQA